MDSGEGKGHVMCRSHLRGPQTPDIDRKSKLFLCGTIEEECRMCPAGKIPRDARSPEPVILPSSRCGAVWGPGFAGLGRVKVLASGHNRWLEWRYKWFPPNPDQSVCRTALAQPVSRRSRRATVNRSSRSSAHPSFRHRQPSLWPP